MANSMFHIVTRYSNGESSDNGTFDSLPIAWATARAVMQGYMQSRDSMVLNVRVINDDGAVMARAWDDGGTMGAWTQEGCAPL